MEPHNHPYLIIGLGNPGVEFENTYHNVGFLAVDAILANNEEPRPWKTHKKLFSYARARNLVFVKPLTFMNESGIAVKEALKKFGVPPEKLVVIHDESDLAIGNLKFSIGKNAAGHNGVQSIMNHIGTKEFQRIRIGVRPVRETARKKAGAFVLSSITIKDRATLAKVFEEIAKSVT